jgi:sugar/nucleoside kinase (ribokinase family)
VPPRYDVLALGEVNVDLILSGLPRLPEWGTEVLAQDLALRLGGSTANFACCCAALGLRVALVGWVGEDDFGSFLLAQLKRSGVSTELVRRAPDRPTGLTVALSGTADRAFVTALGTIDYLTAAHVPAQLLAATRHIHVGSYFLQAGLQPDLPALFARAHELGATTSLDVGYDPHQRWNGQLRAALRQTDVFLPNEVEATGITGFADPEAAAAVLGALGPLVVVKLGPRGACAYEAGHTYLQPAYSVQVADTTACGDAFNAGFLFGWLRKLPVRECLRLGNACGALMATVAGNDPRCLSPERIAALMGTWPPGNPHQPDARHRTESNTA